MVALVSTGLLLLDRVHAVVLGEEVRELLVEDASARARGARGARVAAIPGRETL